MTLSVGVVDYGMGNLHSVAKALAAQKARVLVSNNRSKLKSSDLLVLPGVGSFGAAMTNLAKSKLDDFIRGWIEDGRPYLGICLGLQLLFDSSEEDPGVPGLGAIPGRVVKFRAKDFKKGAYQVPHMGWNNAELADREESGYFSGLSKEDYFYFVHTFYPKPDNGDVVLTTTRYGKEFCSSVATGRLFACQFHPEKSGTVGLNLLSNVVRANS